MITKAEFEIGIMIPINKDNAENIRTFRRAKRSGKTLTFERVRGGHVDKWRGMYVVSIRKRRGRLVVDVKLRHRPATVVTLDAAAPARKG